MILNALDQVVPLLKRHLSPPRSGITNKSIDTRGTHPQSGCKCAEEMAKICRRMGLTGYLGSLLYLHPSFHLVPSFPQFGTSSLLLPGALIFSLGQTCWRNGPTFWAILVWRASNTPCNCLSSMSQISLVSSIQDADIWASNIPLLSQAHGEETEH